VQTREPERRAVPYNNTVRNERGSKVGPIDEHPVDARVLDRVTEGAQCGGELAAGVRD
jgi:hypothetical protein